MYDSIKDMLDILYCKTHALPGCYTNIFPLKFKTNLRWNFINLFWPLWQQWVAPSLRVTNLFSCFIQHCQRRSSFIMKISIQISFIAKIALHLALLIGPKSTLACTSLRHKQLKSNQILTNEVDSHPNLFTINLSANSDHRYLKAMCPKVKWFL